MYTVALFGSGKIGEAITALLAATGEYQVRVCDGDISRAQAVAAQWPGCTAYPLNVDDRAATEELLEGACAVLSALPFFLNKKVALYASGKKVHYLDLTEDVDSTKFISQLAANSESALMPQCGLAPGFISIAAHHLFKTFDTVDTVKMRVGALPIYPTNKLKYNLTWSTDGLINEYCNLCECISNGALMSVVPLEGYETFSLDGDEYEAFNTSGGLGTLCTTLEGKVKNLNYKTIRYVGHRELMAFLLNDLKFTEDRETLKRIFERSITTTAQDKCLILVEVTGVTRGRFAQRTYASTVYNTYVGNRHFGAIQITTAAGICGALDLLVSGKLGRTTGLIKSEDIDLNTFLDNRFGKHFRDEKALKGIT
jgi:saccharopine dehydrogenase-like NADP-dependent oxidoreductase